MKPTDIVLLSSQDGGRHWSAPAPLDLPHRGLVDAPSSILESEDGTWFLGCERWKAYEDTTPLHIKGFAVFSADRGRTWGDRVDFPSANDTARMYSHSRYTRLLDGRIAALQWTQTVGGHRDLDLHFVASDATGSHWAHPHSTGMCGQNSWLVDLGEDTLAALRAVGEGCALDPGVYLTLSLNEGRSWDEDTRLKLYGTRSRTDVTSLERGETTNPYRVAFGQVNAIRLRDGGILAAWRCVDESETIRLHFARVTARQD